MNPTLYYFQLYQPLLNQSIPINILLRDEYTYNKEKWGNLFNFINENNLNTDTVNGYIIYYIQYYQREKYRD